MGAFLDKPKTTIHNVQGKGNDLSFAVGSMQGWRCEMEDAYFASAGIGEGLEDWSFFGVFDGHAGCRVSEHCAKYLLSSIVNTQEFKSGDYTEGIRNGFLHIDEDMRNSSLNFDKSGGSTVVCALVSPTQVYIANCGDSRAVLCRQGFLDFATQDHKPGVPKENERILNAGGKVIIKRVNGALAVSRALGDYEFKNVEGKGQCEQLVSPEPEIFCQSRQDSDEFLVLACDGIWDVMSSEDVCSYIHSRLKLTDDLVSIANEVIDTCLHMGSRDNMSIIIVAFPGAPKVSEEAIAAEIRLEKEIEKVAIEEIQSSEIKNMRELLVALRDRNIEGLPPGGGIHAKYNLVMRIYKAHFPENECENAAQ